MLWPRLWGAVDLARSSHRHSRPRACYVACVCPCDGARAALGADPGVSTWRQDGLVPVWGWGATRSTAGHAAISPLTDAAPARPFYYGIISATSDGSCRTDQVFCMARTSRVGCRCALLSGARSRWRDQAEIVQATALNRCPNLYRRYNVVLLKSQQVVGLLTQHPAQWLEPLTFPGSHCTVPRTPSAVDTHARGECDSSRGAQGMDCGQPEQCGNLCPLRSI